MSITRDARFIKIDSFLIHSNDKKTKIDIANKIQNISYHEGLLQGPLILTVTYVDSGSIQTDKGLKTIIEGLPLVGEERVQIKIRDAKENLLKLEMYVKIIKLVKQDSLKSVVLLELVSKETIWNEHSRVNCRFDGKISDHVKRILSEPDFLNSKKNLFIESTANSLNLFGNNKKPLYTLPYLAKKAVPEGFPVGNTAGFFFFETSKGFHFQSIEGLLSNTQSGNKKKYRSFIFTNTPDGSGSNIPEGYDKILELTPNAVTGDIQSKLEIGTYKTRTILFDPFNCEYKVINPNADNLKKNTAGKRLPTFNSEFDRPKKNKEYTRTQYYIIDRGVLPSGNTQQQLEKSRDKNFDPEMIVSQASMRYNQFFSNSITITIVADFGLNAGDLVFVDMSIPGQTLSTEHGGFYVISQLTHYIDSLQGAFSKLILTRDSIGKKGSAVPAQ